MENPHPSMLDHCEDVGNGAWELGLTEAPVDLGLPAQAHYSNYFLSLPFSLSRYSVIHPSDKLYMVGPDLGFLFWLLLAI